MGSIDRVRFAGPERTVQRNHRELQPAADIGQHRVRPGAHAVDLVDEEEERSLRRADGAGELDGLRLHAFHGGDDQHDRIEHAQRALDFGHEVGMPGGIDEVDFEIVQAERGHRGLDGDAAGALELEGIGLGGAFIDTAWGGYDPGFVEDSFGEGGFTGVDMRQDSYGDDRHAFPFR